MKIQTVEINAVKANPDNPRIIKDDAFDKLVKSVSTFQKMLNIRPIVVDSNMTILGGNMRYEACKAAGLKHIPIIIADELNEEEKKEFIIKDNVSGGEWDWDKLANEWTDFNLEEWGINIPQEILDYEDDEKYITKIPSVVYEPTNDKPDISELFDKSKTDNLIEKINKSKVSEEEKIFLRNAAARHTVFDYRNVAEYYAHSEKEMQELMEQSALIIIDVKRAIEDGYAQLAKDISNISANDNDGDNYNE